MPAGGAEIRDHRLITKLNDLLSYPAVCHHQSYPRHPTRPNEARQRLATDRTGRGESLNIPGCASDDEFRALNPIGSPGTNLLTNRKVSGLLSTGLRSSVSGLQRRTAAVIHDPRVIATEARLAELISTTRPKDSRKTLP